MHEDNKTLEELVVIGYGTQRKADLTGSVANVDASKLNTDLHASAEYRAHLIPVLAARAVEQALKG